ncbi:MAG: hypothetical protein ACREA0_34875 [bacterium]
MIRRATDLEKVRLALRGLSRGDLLIIAERAAKLVPKGKLKTLLGDFVRLDAHYRDDRRRDALAR